MARVSWLAPTYQDPRGKRQSESLSKLRWSSARELRLTNRACGGYACRDAGYHVREYQRTRGSGEVLVDDKLHAQMLQAIADPRRFPQPQTMVLASGDGNDNRGSGSTNFVRVRQH